VVDVGRASRTLVKVVLVLLALLAAASSGVELVADATEETAGARGLLVGALVFDGLLVGGLALVVAAGELVDEIHDVCLLFRLG
jgi:hypothetical protein